MAEQKHRGPMGGGPRGMMPGEKAKDFKGTMGKLISYLGKYLPAIIAVMLLSLIHILVDKGVPVSAMAEAGLFDKLVKVKYEIPNDKPEMFGEYNKEPVSYTHLFIIFAAHAPAKQNNIG